VMAVPHAVNDLKGSASLSTSSMKWRLCLWLMAIKGCV
jgi:hypothetical protein